MFPSRLAAALLLVVFLGSSHAFAQAASFARADINTGLPLWQSAIAGDFDGDGAPDVIVASRSAVGEFAIHLLAGNADGTLAPPRAVAFPDVVLSLASGDVNGDGALDLLFLDGEWLSVLPGNGDGTFGQRITSPPVFSGRPPVIADVDGDGRLDAVFGTQDGFVSISLGNGDGSFGEPTLLATSDGGRADNVAAGDFNEDGLLDLLASNVGQPDAFSGATVELYLGRGDGSFAPPAHVAVAGYPGPLATGDFNGDGHLDAAVGSYALALVTVLYGAGDGTFLFRNDLPAAGPVAAIAVADFDGDGQSDIAACGAPVLTVLAIAQGGTFRYSETAAASSCNSIAVADLNLDGRPDLAMNYFAADGTLSLFLNTTTAADVTPPAITVAATPALLWPANGRAVAVRVSGMVTDADSGVDGGSVTFAVLDEYGVVQPAGSVEVDAAGRYSAEFVLTASRRGDDRDGRTYTVVIRAVDRAGNAATAEVQVIVPHDRGGR